MLILSPGHYPADPGACFQAGQRLYCEHGEALDWVHRIAHYARQRVMVDIAPGLWLGDKVRWINRHAPRAELAAEIHFNSDPKRAGRGSETLYCPGSEAGALAARIVQGSMAGLFPPDRGAIEGWYRMDRPGHVDYPGDVEGDERVDYFLKATACPALILEPEFIHNRQKLHDQRDTACERIAEALVEALAALQAGQPRRP
jgi:N-acetylmuramoyl-L-alanine amidase